MIKYLTPLMLILLGCSCAPARMAQTSVADRANEAPRPVSSVYHVVADIQPESLLVRARVEIDFQNLTADTLRRLTLIRPINAHRDRSAKEQGARIDSLSLNGVPISIADVADSPLIPIALHTPLKQGERAAVGFSVTVTVRVGNRWRRDGSECVEFVNWLPFVTAWAGSSDGLLKREAEPADFAIEMTIDSGWLVVASGELLNDKELLGMVPNADSVFADVIHNPYAADGYVFSRLPAKAGRDTYVWRARFQRGFAFLVLSNYLLDRGRKGDLAVELYYPHERASLYQSRAIADALQFFSQTSALTDISLNRPLRLVVVGKRTAWLSPNVQLLSAKGNWPKFVPPEVAP